MKRFVLFILVLSLVSISCKTLNNLRTPTDEPNPPTNSDGTQTPPNTNDSAGKIKDMAQRLDELGAERCENNPDFYCVTINVPLNHFDSANGETIDVVFAVSPAQGERYGMYVQAFPGGPGGKGISYASTYYFPSDIVDHYDLVFFDQRGLGLSNPLECKTALAKYTLWYLNINDNAGEEGFDTPEEQKTAEDTAKSFVDACVTEMGIDPAKLQYFRTDQVAEDIETFRQAIGDDKFMLYGVSYGTSVAQTYARAHADHLDGLILDGTQDTTQSGNQIAFSQWEAMNMVLSEVFKACDADKSCSKDMGGNSQTAYDAIQQKLADAPVQFDYPLSNGSTVKRTFTFNMLDFTASYQLYDLQSRTELMHAIASAKAGDMIPLVNIYYNKANIDPETGELMDDPSFSNTMYYVVWCSDDAYYSGTPEEREAKMMQEGQKLNGLIPRLDLDVLQLGLTCPLWPSAPSSPANLPPLKAEGVPTFVLDATLDPATPFHEGKTVYENLSDGYFIYVNGGLHGIYGRGPDCPDQYVNDFLLNGTLPDQREIVCDWGDAVIQ